MVAVTLRLWMIGLLVAGWIAGSGCQPRPKAPALLDEPVYQNDREGFRFLVPEGWIMAARADVPPGPAQKERLLVQYRRANADKQAMLEVSQADLPEPTDLQAYLSGPSFGASRWKSSAAPEPIEVHGVNGTRFRLTAQVRGEQLAREVTAFRRGERVYFFTLLYAPADTSAPEQARRAVGRIVWTR
jgi:predicted Zn-dependent protease